MSEVKLFFYAGKEKNWYCIEPPQDKQNQEYKNDDDDGIKALSPLFKMPTGLPRRAFGCVASGCNLFVIGGHIEGESPVRVSKAVYKMDTSLPSPHHWEKLPSMNAGRAFPAVAAVGDSVYVFGTYYCDWADDKSWAEVYHGRKWENTAQLPDPYWYPSHFGRYPPGVHVVDEDAKKIYVSVRCLGGPHEQLCFNVSSNSWDLNGIPLRCFGSLGGRPVVVNGIMYRYQLTHLYAYDLSRPIEDKNNQVLVPGFCHHIRSFVTGAHSGFLFHLGDTQVCLVIQADPVYPGYSAVWCQYFCISRKPDRSFDFVFGTREKYLIEEGSIQDCLLLVLYKHVLSIRRRLSLQ